ncbi:MAG: LysE family translocator [Desulfobulbaceae bacterium]|nr:LysE family translocator [Desulfobulbaceae bacterium]
MIEPALLSLYLGALVAVYLSPGPDMALIMAVSAGQGRRAGLHTLAGIGAARFLHVLGSGLGLAALFAAHPSFLEIVKFTGAGYLLFWAWKMMHAGPVDIDPGQTFSSAGSDMLRGFLTNLLNPKALLFCSLLLPQFTSSERGALLPQFIGLGVILVSVGIVFDVFYVFLSDGMVQRIWAGSGPGTRTGLHLEKARNWLMMTVFAGMAGRLVVG